MPKPMYVWSGSAWVSVASEVESLATYATQSYADNQPGMKLIVPSSVAVGSGSGSVSTQGTVTFSSATSVSLNNVFSTTYRNYRIILDFNSSGTGQCAFRFRVGGADNSAANYSYQAGDISSTTFTGGRGTGVTSSAFGNYDSGGLTSFTIDVFNPFETLRTNVQATNFFASSGAKVGWFYTQFTNTTSFTGFTLLPDTGNITGTISVYGYKAG